MNVVLGSRDSLHKRLYMLKTVSSYQSNGEFIRGKHSFVMASIVFNEMQEHDKTLNSYFLRQATHRVRNGTHSDIKSYVFWIVPGATHLDSPSRNHLLKHRCYTRQYDKMLNHSHDLQSRPYTTLFSWNPPSHQCWFPSFLRKKNTPR